MEPVIAAPPGTQSAPLTTIGIDKLRGLESVRGLAAVYVLLHHGNKIFLNDRFVALRFGQEAVIAFFLLSGFVIWKSTCGKGRPIASRAYLIKRLRRIYPLFVAAIALAYGCQSLREGAWATIDWHALIGNLLMLQDHSSKPGAWFEAYQNPVLWSVSYEWWFYLLFLGIVLVTKDAMVRGVIAAGIALIGTAGYLLHPNQVCTFGMYFAIWWAGAEMAREVADRGRIGRGQFWVIGFLAVLAALWGIPVLAKIRAGSRLDLGLYPTLELRHIVAAVLFCLIALLWQQFDWKGFQRSLGWASFLAPISYGIYLTHWPIMSAAASLLGPSRFLPFLVSVVITIVLACVLELWIQPLINTWTDKFLYKKTAMEQTGQNTRP